MNYIHITRSDADFDAEVNNSRQTPDDAADEVLCYHMKMDVKLVGPYTFELNE